MSRATWLADVLTDAGLTVRPYPGWETNGKDDFAPRGHMLHHTVTRPTASDAVVDRVLAVTGSSRVKAPLGNISTNRDGSVSIIAAGTANHGGVGRWNGVAGNRYWVGDEMKNWGTAAREPWTARQVDSALIAAAAILTHIGSDASWLCGHKEYATPPGRKVDPHSLNMNALRAKTKAIMEDDMSAYGPENWDAADWAAFDERGGKAAWAGGYTILGRHPNTVVRSIEAKVGALDLEGVSEAELDQRVARLIAELPPAFIAKLKQAL